jgi:hypothetical protein
MSTVIMTEESEGLDDSKPFSPLALVAFLLSLVSIFSILYIPITFVAFAVVVLGAFVLLRSSRHNFSSASKVLASLAIILGATSATAGFLGRSFSTAGDLKTARDVAETYLNSIYKGDFGRMALLSNIEVPTEAFQNRTPTNEEKFHYRKKNVSTEPLVQEVRARKSEPKWTFVRLESVNPTPYSCSYKLIYRDDALPVSPLYLVIVKRDSPQGGPTTSSSYRGVSLDKIDMSVRWNIDGLTTAK